MRPSRPLSADESGEAVKAGKAVAVKAVKAEVEKVVRVVAGAEVALNGGGAAAAVVPTRVRARFRTENIDENNVNDK